MALHRNEVKDALSAMATGIASMPPADKHNVIDPAKEPEFQTDKDAVKLVGCRDCQRPLVVTTFYAAAKAICRECSGATAGNGGTATVGQPIPGSTDPAKAVNLADCLVNRQFAEANCPLCAEAMELKLVVHSDSYGPRQLEGYDKTGVPRYKVSVGETVTLQCNSCKTTVNMSTMHQHEYRRQNEPKKRVGMESAPLESVLGIRSAA